MKRRGRPLIACSFCRVANRRWLFRPATFGSDFAKSADSSIILRSIGGLSSTLPRCEETQGFSPFFRAWHEGLAQRLIDRYSLRAKKIIEIGCGKGEFLALLCDLGHNRGIGFDPAYVPERNRLWVC